MKYICDGHEYSISDSGYRDGYDLYTIKNNYGSPVAVYSRTVNDEYWSVDLIGGDRIASIHENAIEDNALDHWAIQSYVAWAIDNDTVEDHC